MNQPARRIDSTLPAATLSQRVRAMGDGAIVVALRGLAGRTDPGSVEALRAVTAEAQRRGISL